MDASSETLDKLQNKINKESTKNSRSKRDIFDGNVEENFNDLVANSQALGCLHAEAENYQSQAHKIKEGVEANREAYYHHVPKDVKIRTTVFGFINGHPKHETIYELQFNAAMFNQHLSESENLISRTSAMKNEAREKADIAKQNLARGIKQLKAKITELDAQKEDLDKKNDAITEELYQSLPENANLKYEADQITEQTNQANRSIASNKLLESDLQEASALLQESTTQTQKMEEALHLDNISLLEQIKNKAKSTKEILVKMSNLERTVYYAKLYQILEQNPEAHKEVSARLLTLESMGIDNHCLAVIAIGANNLELFKKALDNVTDMETILFDKKNLLQLVLSSEDTEIRKIGLEKALQLTESPYFSVFQAGLYNILKTNDDKSLLNLLEAKGEMLEPAFKTLVRNAANLRDKDMLDKILSLFPNLAEESLNEWNQNLFDILIEDLESNSQDAESLTPSKESLATSKEIIESNNIDVISNIQQLFVRMQDASHKASSYFVEKSAKKINIALLLFPEAQETFKEQVHIQEIDQMRQDQSYVDSSIFNQQQFESEYDPLSLSGISIASIQYIE